MPSRDLKDIQSIIKQMRQRAEVKKPVRAIVHAIDGSRVDVRVPGSPGVMRHIEVVGNVERIRVGQSVALRWEHGRPQAILVVPEGSDPNTFRNSIPVDGTSIVWGENGLEIAQGGVGLGHMNFDPMLDGAEYNLSFSANYPPPSEADDKFVWKDGRVGNQIVHGGTTPDGILILRATSADSPSSTARIYVDHYVEVQAGAEFNAAVYFDLSVAARGIPIQIQSAPAGWGQYVWADSDGVTGAYIQYQESSGIMEFAIHGDRLMALDSDTIYADVAVRVGVDYPIVLDGTAGDIQFAALADSDVPLAPAAGDGLLYMRADGLLYFRNDSDEFDLTLGNDSEYLLVSGTRPLTGDLSFGDNNITNVGSIDLDVIRADAANGSVTIELDNAAGADLIVGNNNALVVEGDNDRVGIGTAAPTGTLGIQLTSSAGGSLVALGLNRTDTRAVTAADLPQTISASYTDAATADRISAQCLRFTFMKNAGATGVATAFDAAIVVTPVFNESANYPFYSLMMEAPVVALGKTLATWRALQISAPSGAGTVTTFEAIRADGGKVFFGGLSAAAASTDVNINGSNELHSVTSSKRFKKFIQPLGKRFDSSLIYNLRPRSFVWKENSGSAGLIDFGLIAEEAYETMPEIVNLDADDRPYSIRTGLLPIMMLAEMQRLERRIGVLEAAG